jgi:hypothetical protein
MTRVFIDCGSYTGDTVKLFMEKFPDAESYGVVCFEPDPRHLPHYTAVPWVLWQKAVWIADETRPFYLGNTDGSTLLAEKSTGELNRGEPLHRL